MEFKHSVPVQLRFNDADALGHVNNSVYFTFYDLGKTEYFKAIRGGEIPKEVDIVVAHAEVDFIASVFLNDEIDILIDLSGYTHNQIWIWNAKILCKMVIKTNHSFIPSFLFNKCHLKPIF